MATTRVSKKKAAKAKVIKKPRASSKGKKKTVPLRRPVVRSKNVSKSVVHRTRPAHLVLQKHESNPIIEPRTENFWEMKATFNPAAVAIDGKIHLLYRAIGGNDVSVLGYAASEDGVTIMDRPEEFAFEHVIRGIKPLTTAPKIKYLSGGGCAGGSEDPRLTLIEEDKKVYLTYTAFDGWGSVRIALSSIAKDDFVDRRWRWSEPVFLSPPGEIHKNWILFPEKINGKYAVLHSISPKILIDYFDSLDYFAEDDAVIGGSIRKMEVTEAGRWESRVRGAGPPPIKTKLGWLLLYHAMDVREPNRYKLGAMILDLSDPTKVLYRSSVPILEPEEWYENTGWKSGIIYSCGAVAKDGELYVYYGGADSVVCVAMANLDHFLDELVKYGTPKLTKKTNVKAKTSDARR